MRLFSQTKTLKAKTLKSIAAAALAATALTVAFAAVPASAAQRDRNDTAVNGDNNANRGNGNVGRRNNNGGNRGDNAPSSGNDNNATASGGNGNVNTPTVGANNNANAYGTNRRGNNPNVRGNNNANANGGSRRDNNPTVGGNNNANALPGYWGTGGGKAFVDEKWKQQNGTSDASGWHPNPTPNVANNRTGDGRNGGGRDGDNRGGNGRWNSGGNDRDWNDRDNRNDGRNDWNDRNRGPRQTYYVPPRWGGAPPPRWSSYAPRPLLWNAYVPGEIVILRLFPAYFSARFSAYARNQHQWAFEQALAAPLGQAITWREPMGFGSVTATRDGYAGDSYCREFVEEVVIAGERQQAYGTACQQPNGSWVLVERE